ncbi:MAG: hypothetical protein HY043_10950 [Verrucomicrobia bacterium]|nr:hypothetical protein [Verrucomicrobiota bacterium]
MKQWPFIAGAVLVSLLLWVGASAPPKTSSPTKEFMRAKLGHSQSVLEGLALEDFNLVLNHARRLGAMSREMSWRAFDNPDYAQHSENFRRSVDALTKAATDHNLDGATLAYFKVTLSCVECHKYVRGKKVADLNPPRPAARDAMAQPSSENKNQPRVTS